MWSVVVGVFFCRLPMYEYMWSEEPIKTILFRYNVKAVRVWCERAFEWAEQQQQLKLAQMAVHNDCKTRNNNAKPKSQPANSGNSINTKHHHRQVDATQWSEHNAEKYKMPHRFTSIKKFMTQHTPPPFSPSFFHSPALCNRENVLKHFHYR